MIITATISINQHQEKLHWIVMDLMNSYQFPVMVLMSIYVISISSATDLMPGQLI